MTTAGKKRIDWSSFEPKYAPVFKEEYQFFGTSGHVSDRLIITEHKATPVLKEVLDEMHIPFSKVFRQQKPQLSS